jgi:hypothetical protein
LCECSEVDLREPGEYVLLPVSIGEESVEVGVEVESLPSSLYCKDSSEFTLIDTEYLTERSPSSFKEDGE